jgi:hypothetical protein
MMSFLAYITGFFMNFELLSILTDYAKGVFRRSISKRDRQYNEPKEKRQMGKQSTTQKTI